MSESAALSPDRRDWFVVGAPWDCSGTGRGEQAAPNALRAAGLDTLVGRDLGDVPTMIGPGLRDAKTGVLALDETVRASHVLSEALTNAMRDLPGSRPLVLGGDCSILLGIFPALLRQVGATGLWFLDGHPDFLDGHTSDTGETADMDLAVLTGVGADVLVALAGVPPMLPASDVVLIGHRSSGLDDGSAAELARLPAELRRIDAMTVGQDATSAGELAMRWAADSGGPMWLHVDLDVLDPESMPAVTYPQPGGLDWDQLTVIITTLARSPQLLGVSVADFRPDLDPTGEFARRTVQLLEVSIPLEAAGS